MIPIHCPTQRDSNASQKLPPQLAKLGSDEVVIIELQGSLVVESSSDSDRDGQMVGKLRIDDTTDKPTLTIGHHLLEGKFVNLPKPLAVIRRSDHDPEDDVDRGHARQELPGWNIVSVVKRKIVFSKRPMPIVGSTPAGIGGSRARR